jgi:uncharacterized protein DUF6527
MACPDGCGSVLTVNLDPRAGKAWRLYARDRMSLYPSVWRDGGCGAHFVLWKDRILWCDGKDDGDPPRYEPVHQETVFAALSDIPKSAKEIADELDEIPWEVDRSLKHLVRSGRADAVGNEPAQFRKAEVRPEKMAPSVVQTTLQRPQWWRRLWRRK